MLQIWVKTFYLFIIFFLVFTYYEMKNGPYLSEGLISDTKPL